MRARVCPWYHAYLFDNIFRRLLHNPRKMLSEYAKPGMTVADFGCGMGFFSLAMARLVGEKGRVKAVDLQQQMLKVLKRRARRRGLMDRIELIKCGENDLGISEPIDFALAFWMVHEVPDSKRFLSQVKDLLKPGGHLYVAEPSGHVSAEQFETMVADAETLGLKLTDRPKVRASIAAVFHTSF